MRITNVSVFIVCLFFAGCGNVDWFPTKSSTTTNPGTPTPTTSPTLTKAFSPAAILAGTTTSTLTFTITNSTGNPAQSGLTFTDQLPAGLTANGDLSQCGGTVEFTSTNKIIFGGGKLAADAANCKITATVSGTNSGNDVVSLTNKATDVTDLHGGLVSNLTDQTLKVFPSSIKDSTGEVTASGLSFPSVDSTKPSGDQVRTYSLSVKVTNARATAVNNVSVDVMPIDANGVEVQVNNIQFFSQTINDPIPANTTTPITIPASPIPVEVPLAVAERIQFWRIVSVLAP